MGLMDDVGAIAHKSPIVIRRRLAMLAKGGRAANVEAVDMVMEKAELAVISAASLVVGHPIEKIVKKYRRKVESNRRRLWIRSLFVRR
jgi:hypothetical protein